MNDFIFFVGRFHVVVLHLPIGMLLLTVVLDLLSRSRRHSYLVQALPLCWAATALTATLTVVLGLLHFAEGGFDGAAAAAHRNYGVSVAVTSLVVWLLAAKLPALYLRVRTFSIAALLLLITMTGHYGGNLTHGPTYLVEFAPTALRELAGLPARRIKPTDVAQADPWHDVVSPLLQARCVSCHNADKQRGQLDLSSLTGLQAGGESGAVVVSGSAAMSELYRRITLPPEHDDVMPAEGKAALSEAQVQLIGWWIDAGMPVDVAVSQLQIESSVVELLAAELGLGAANKSSTADSYPAVAAATLEQLSQQGWLTRRQSQSSNGLIASLSAPGQAVSAAMLQALNNASLPIVELDLTNAHLDDAKLALLRNMPTLEVLKLGGNSLTDEGMAIVKGMQSLNLINLHSNAGISDVGLMRLSELTNLKTLYVWGTAITPTGIERLIAAVPGLAVHGGSNPE